MPRGERRRSREQTRNCKVIHQIPKLVVNGILVLNVLHKQVHEIKKGTRGTAPQETRKQRYYHHHEENLKINILFEEQKEKTNSPLPRTNPFVIIVHHPTKAFCVPQDLIEVSIYEITYRYHPIQVQHIRKHLISFYSQHLFVLLRAPREFLQKTCPHNIFLSTLVLPI